LTVLAKDSLTGSVLDVVSLDARETLAEGGIELKALNRNCNAIEFDSVLT
jgi:hypothetical protein